MTFCRSPSFRQKTGDKFVTDLIFFRYFEKKHSNYISSLLWLDKDTLLSGGWDGKVNKVELSKDPLVPAYQEPVQPDHDGVLLQAKGLKPLPLKEYDATQTTQVQAQEEEW